MNHVFAEGARADLRWLADLLSTSSFYLAGSGAISSYLEHRTSLHSLQLMSESNPLASANRRDLLADLLRRDAELRVETARDGYLFCRTVRQTGLRFFYYPYPLIGQPTTVDGLRIASLADLGLMKLGAIISRGFRADFYDLFLICQQLPLQALLDQAPAKFHHVRDFPLQAFKGLADLSLARDDDDPPLTPLVSWSRITDWIESEVAELAREYVGLSP